MSFCSNCGSQLADGTNFCPFCGAEVMGGGNNGTRTHSYVNGRPVSHQEDIDQNKILAVLAYLGVLVIVPLLAAKDSPFVRFHANQGLVLLIASVIWNIVVRIVQLSISAILRTYLLAILLNIANVLILVFMIIGIINAVRGEEKELPVIGHYRILK